MGRQQGRPICDRSRRRGTAAGPVDDRPNDLDGRLREVAE